MKDTFRGEKTSSRHDSSNVCTNCQLGRSCSLLDKNLLKTITNHHHNVQMPSTQPLPPSKPLNVVPLPVAAAKSRPPESPQTRPQQPATEPQPPCRVLPPQTCHKLPLPQLAHSLTWSESYQLQEVFSFPLSQDPR